MYNEQIENTYYLTVIGDIPITKVNQRFSAINSDGYKVYTKLAYLRKGSTPNWLLKNPYAVENAKEFMRRNDCELLEDEYTHKRKLKYLAQCGHEHFIYFDRFVEGHGRICPECVRKEHSSKISLSEDELTDHFKDNGCFYISKEYRNGNMFVTYKASCGHTMTYSKELFDSGYGRQCKECTRETRGTYNFAIAERLKELWSDEYAVVYIIRCFNNTESFYKIGITKNDLKQRLTSYSLSYSYEIIGLVDINKYDAVFLEDRLHNIHRHYSYTPRKAFSGHTECFSDIDVVAINEEVQVKWVQLDQEH